MSHSHMNGGHRHLLVVPGSSASFTVAESSSSHLNNQQHHHHQHLPSPHHLQSPSPVHGQLHSAITTTTGGGGTAMSSSSVGGLAVGRVMGSLHLDHPTAHHPLHPTHHLQISSAHQHHHHHHPQHPHQTPLSQSHPHHHHVSIDSANESHTPGSNTPTNLTVNPLAVAAAAAAVNLNLPHLSANNSAASPSSSSTATTSQGLPALAPVTMAAAAAAVSSHQPAINAIQERFLAHYDASFQWLIQEAQKGCDHLTMSRLLKEMRNAFWDLMGFAVKKAESEAQAQTLLIQQQQQQQQQHTQHQHGSVSHHQLVVPSVNGIGQNGGGQGSGRGRKRKAIAHIEHDFDQDAPHNGPAYTLEEANARINQIKSSNLHITVSSDMERVNEWLATRPGTSGHSLTVDQRRDVVEFYEMFKPKYSVKWLINQIEAKYGLSSLRGYFTRFMSKCYKVTNAGHNRRGPSAAAVALSGALGGGGTGAVRGRKPGTGKNGAKYRSIESIIENGQSLPNNGSHGKSGNGIGRNRSGKLGQTAAEDVERVEGWIRSGTKRDGNLTVDQKRDVIVFFEAFKEKYIPAWLAKQIARKYDMKKLQFDFNRFMARCYKSTGNGSEHEGNGGGGGGHQVSSSSAATGGQSTSGNNGGVANNLQLALINGGNAQSPDPGEASSKSGGTPKSPNNGLPLGLIAGNSMGPIPLTTRMISNNAAPTIAALNGTNVPAGTSVGGSGGLAANGSNGQTSSNAAVGGLSNGGQNGGHGHNGNPYNGLMHQIIASQQQARQQQQQQQQEGTNGGSGPAENEQQLLQSAAAGWGQRVADGSADLDAQQLQELCEMSQRQQALKMEQHYQFY